MSKRTDALNNGEKSVKTYDFPEIRRPIKKTWGQFFYDSETGQYLGRTPKAWGQLLLFYIIFYIILAAMFAIMIQGLLATLSDDYPRWQLDSSIIGTNPGLGFRPISAETERGSLISFVQTKKSHIKYWVDNLNEALAPYNTSIKLANGKDRKLCNFENGPGPDEVCAFEVDKFKECNPANQYGYAKAAPCIFVKLNKIYGWVPDFYDDVLNLPGDMPESLKTHIKTIPASHRRQVWVSCSGEHSSDREGLKDVAFVSHQGFPGYFYPYKMQPGYLSPLVPIQIRVEPNRLVNIECRAWAKNIHYSGSLRDRQGSIHFELMIDTE